MTSLDDFEIFVYEALRLLFVPFFFAGGDVRLLTSLDDFGVSSEG